MRSHSYYLSRVLSFDLVLKCKTFICMYTFPKKSSKVHLHLNKFALTLTTDNFWKYYKCNAKFKQYSILKLFVFEYKFNMKIIESSKNTKFTHFLWTCKSAVVQVIGAKFFHPGQLGFSSLVCRRLTSCLKDLCLFSSEEVLE